MIENQFLSMDQNSYMASNAVGYSQAQTVYYQDPIKPFYYGNNNGYGLSKLDNQATEHVPDNPLTAQTALVEDKMTKKNKKGKDFNFNCK